MDHQTEPMPPAPRDGAAATAADEATVLAELYGPPDADGVYRGASQADEQADAEQADEGQADQDGEQ